MLSGECCVQQHSPVSALPAETGLDHTLLSLDMWCKPRSTLLSLDPGASLDDDILPLHKKMCFWQHCLVNLSAK